MGNRDMPLLDALGVVRGDDDRNVNHLLRRTSTLSQKSDDGETALLRFGDRTVDVFRFAAGADRDENVAGVAEPLHLAGENVLEPQIVPAGGQHGAVGRKSDRGKGTTVRLGHPDDQLRGDVLGIGSAPAIAAEQYLPLVVVT